jgi:hypothetical protein
MKLNWMTMALFLIVLSLGIGTASASANVVYSTIVPAEVADVSPHTDSYMEFNVTCWSTTNATPTAGVTIWKNSSAGVYGLIGNITGVAVTNASYDMVYNMTAANTTIGDRYIAAFFCNDETNQSYGAANVTRTIQNRLPVVTAVDLSPDLPTTLQDLKANATCTDPDDVSEQVLSAWLVTYRNGAVISTLAPQTVATGVNSLILTTAASGTIVGDVWIEQIICGDGIVNSTQTNDTVTIQNQLPVLTLANFSTSSGSATPNTDETVYSYATCTDADTTDQNITAYVMYYNGTNNVYAYGKAWDFTSGVQKVITGLPAAVTKVGATWTAEIVCSDLVANSSAANDSVTIANRAPVVTASFTPIAPYYTETLTGALTCSDGDSGDQVLTGYTKTWLNAAAFIANRTTPLTNATIATFFTITEAQHAPYDAFITQFTCDDGVVNATLVNVTRTIGAGSGGGGGGGAPVAPVTTPVVAPLAVADDTLFGYDKTTVYIIAFVAIAGFAFYAWQKRWF